MKVKVLLFASFKEQLGCSELWVEVVAKEATVNDLCLELVQKEGAWRLLFEHPGQTLKIAINREMAKLQSQLTQGDEVAFFPPVTGG